MSFAALIAHVPTPTAFALLVPIAAASTAAALDTVPAFAGSASALIGSLQYGSGITSSLLLAGFRDGTPWTMAWIMALFAVASAAMAWRVGSQQ